MTGIFFAFGNQRFGVFSIASTRFLPSSFATSLLMILSETLVTSLVTKIREPVLPAILLPAYLQETVREQIAFSLELYATLP
jgi:hypothetical protein